MKLLQNSNKILIGFLVVLFIINIIQGYTTELIADEAYYWMYSNFLDWGYFDHPPMVAVWISISKLFFSSGELSVRFFSAVTLSITFYFVWLLIEHPKKKENTWLFILITATTSLFNAYGFITVPDTPLLFFMAIFLFGYKKYLKEQSFLSYAILTLSIAGMMYSKYQAILIVFFVLLSNLKTLKDYKIWIMTFFVILLYAPHLYWQYSNEYPSFKYHLSERQNNKPYKFENTVMLFVNLIAIIGFTFPIIYKAFYKNLKNKDLFQKALNFTVIGFSLFFFLSTFKGPTQAQWVVPISIPLIIIPFSYIINNPKYKKAFLILTCITLVASSLLRFVMASDSLFGKELEMHGNKRWVTALNKKLDGKDALFLNSYQSASWYWFYSGSRPYQYNAWYTRKNHYDLLDYNKNATLEKVTLVYKRKQNATDSIHKRNTGKLYLTDLFNYKREGVIIKSNHIATLTKNALNSIKIEIENPNNYPIENISFQVVLRDQKREFLKNIDTTKNPKHPQVFKAYLKNNYLEFELGDYSSAFKPAFIQVIGKGNTKNMHDVKMGMIDCK